MMMRIVSLLESIYSIDFVLVFTKNLSHVASDRVSIYDFKSTVNAGGPLKRTIRNSALETLTRWNGRLENAVVHHRLDTIIDIEAHRGTERKGTIGNEVQSTILAT